MKRSLVILAACLVGLAPAAASAREFGDRYEHRIVGRVIDFTPYNLQLTRGPHMELHRGTVINPTGVVLQRGMEVSVLGHMTSDGNFSADEIDLVRRSWVRHG